MKDFEKRPSKDRGYIKGLKSNPNKARRLFGSTAIAGLAALALAIGLRGGNGEYDQATKDSLKTSLRPTAVKIARGAIRLSSPDWHRYRVGPKMIIEVGDTVPPFKRSYPNYGTQIDVSVTTGMTEGRPDPKKVESVDISRSQHYMRKGSNSWNDPSYENSRTVYIDSPQSNDLPDSFFTGGQDYSGHGAWSGSAIDVKGQLAAKKGFQMNTDNLFAVSANIDIFNPESDTRIQTADTVANMAESLYDRLHEREVDRGLDTAVQPPR